jgi:hypothetical protein
LFDDAGTFDSGSLICAEGDRLDLRNSRHAMLREGDVFGDTSVMVKWLHESSQTEIARRVRSLETRESSAPSGLRSSRKDRKMRGLWKLG